MNALRDAGAIRTIGVVMIGAENRDNERAIERFARRARDRPHSVLETINRDALLDVFRIQFRPQVFPVTPRQILLSIWHPFTQEALDPAPIRIERAEGVYLYTADGRATASTPSPPGG